MKCGCNSLFTLRRFIAHFRVDFPFHSLRVTARPFISRERNVTVVAMSSDVIHKSLLMYPAEIRRILGMFKIPFRDRMITKIRQFFSDH